MMKRRYIPIVLLTSLYASIASAQEWKTIRVAVASDYMPFSWVSSSGELQGFDVEVARELCQRLEAKCEFNAKAWNNLIPSLLEDQYDVVLSGISITDSRKEKLDFSVPYINIPSRFISKKTHSIDFSDLTQYKIGVRAGAANDKYVTSLQGDGAHIVRFDSFSTGYFQLSNDDIDLIFDDAALLYDTVLSQRGGENYHFVGEPVDDVKWFGEGAGIGVNKSNKELTLKINKELTEFIKTDKYNQLFARYLKVTN
ncbi:transporter substrate-binding domain-containing protein [Vibrio sp.]|nr:transporter substrate-binding domain-containing protein [Vibrio sp.]